MSKNESKLLKALVERFGETGLVIGTLGAIILLSIPIAKLITPLADQYFAFPKPKIVYFSNGQPVITEIFENNEELKIYEDTSTFYKEFHDAHLSQGNYHPSDSMKTDSLAKDNH